MKNNRGGNRRFVGFHTAERYIAFAAGKYIALREQYIAPSKGGISLIAKGDEL